MARISKPLDPASTGSAARNLEAELRRRIIGQDEAIQQIVRMYQTFLAGLCNRTRPVGNLLFLGPTGTGKTRLVEAVAEILAGDVRAVVKIDCAEFQHSHEIAKLIGSPPGYLGHRETHPALSQEALDQYLNANNELAFVLFDEIEKASDALWNLLLGILDRATLTLGDNRRVDFSRALIFMTSNLGTADMNSILRPHLGFAPGEADRRDADGVPDGKLADRLSRAGIDAARRRFTPEFMNRIDRTLVFNPLGMAELRKILELELDAVQERIFDLLQTMPFVIAVTDAAKERLVLEGTDARYGARHLKRTVDRNVVQPLSNLIATGQVRDGDLVRVDYDVAQRCFTFYRDSDNMPPHVMAKLAQVAALTAQRNRSSRVTAAGTKR